MTWPVLAIIGAIVIIGITFLFWDTRPKVRSLPIAYCSVFGMIFARAELNALSLVKGALAGIAAGLVITLGIWLQVKDGGSDTTGRGSEEPNDPAA
jgi:hypothetical protein